MVCLSPLIDFSSLILGFIGAYLTSQFFVIDLNTITNLHNYYPLFVVFVPSVVYIASSENNKDLQTIKDIYTITNVSYVVCLQYIFNDLIDLNFHVLITSLTALCSLRLGMFLNRLFKAKTVEKAKKTESACHQD